MRLWPWQMLDVLPRQQLLSQFRECCAIAKSISEKGTPNHVLVNKVMDYPDEHFNRYTAMVHNEMHRRGYKCDLGKFMKYRSSQSGTLTLPLFDKWHNNRYLRQCLYNLQEKFDAGAIADDEWKLIAGKFGIRFDLN